MLDRNLDVSASRRGHRGADHTKRVPKLAPGYLSARTDILRACAPMAAECNASESRLICNRVPR